MKAIAALFLLAPLYASTACAAVTIITNDAPNYTPITGGFKTWKGYANSGSNPENATIPAGTFSNAFLPICVVSPDSNNAAVTATTKTPTQNEDGTITVPVYASTPNGVWIICMGNTP